MIPIGLETSSRPLPVTSRPSDLHDLLRDDAGHLHRMPERREEAEACAFEPETEPVAVVDELRGDGTERQLLAVAPDGQRQLLAAGVADRRGDLVGLHGLPVDRDDAVPGLQADRLRGRGDPVASSGATVSTVARRLTSDGHEEER